jgi:SAM-dependent methyltransferase
VEELQWLDAMLAWPAEWSALHGIAEIKTPVVKIVACTDATAERLVVQILGGNQSQIDGAATGLVFPYGEPSRPAAVTSSHRFRLGLDNPIETVESDEFASIPWYVRDNGFATQYAMDRSHAPILQRVRKLVESEQQEPRKLRVLDLGCGNGALARKINRFHPEVIPAGVDVDENKIAHARVLNPLFSTEFTAADLFSLEAIPEDRDLFLAILMLGRLTEVPLAKARCLLERLERKRTQLLVYAYDDYVHQFGSLASMAEAVGIELLDLDRTADVSTAQVLLRST